MQAGFCGGGFGSAADLWYTVFIRISDTDHTEPDGGQNPAVRQERGGQLAAGGF